MSRAIDAAAELLCAQRIRRLKINPLHLEYMRPIYFDTMENYCVCTKMTRRQLTEGLSRDGLTVLRGDLPPLVLYNGKAPPSRRAFTLAHEVGHICLGHHDDAAQNEAQTNLFAANLLLPRILLRELKQLFEEISVEQICSLFSVSKQAAAMQLRDLPAAGFSAAEQELLCAYGKLLPQPGEPELGF